MFVSLSWSDKSVLIQQLPESEITTNVIRLLKWERTVSYPIALKPETSCLMLAIHQRHRAGRSDSSRPWTQELSRVFCILWVLSALWGWTTMYRACSSYSLDVWFDWGLGTMELFLFLKDSKCFIKSWLSPGLSRSYVWAHSTCQIDVHVHGEGCPTGRRTGQLCLRWLSGCPVNGRGKLVWSRAYL